MNERNIKVPTYLKEFYIDSKDYEAENNNQINMDANTEKTKNEILDYIEKLNELFENIQKGEVKTIITLQEIIYTINGKPYTKHKILKVESAEAKKAEPINTTVIRKRTVEIDERCFSIYYEVGKYNKIIYDDGTDWASPEPFETYWK